MWVLTWAHVISLFGTDCACPCVTHMGWPWGPHLCLPIQNPYKDQPCESYLGHMWAAYMGLIVFAHVWLIWVGHEVPICVYPFRTHIQINHCVSYPWAHVGSPIWVWLCLLMWTPMGWPWGPPFVFIHSEPIYRSTMCVLPWAHVGSIYGSDCVAHVWLIWVGHEVHICVYPFRNPYTDQPCESYLGLMWAAYMGLIVFAHVWLIWVGHEVHICVYPFRTHIQINHVSPTLGSCGQHIWVWLCLLMCDSYGLAMRSPYVFTHSEPIYRSTMCVLPWAHVGSLYGSDCVCSCVTHMGWPWGPICVYPFRTHIRSTMCVLPWAHVGSYMGLIVFAHVWLIWVGHEAPICVYPFRTHIQINHVSPTLAHVGSIYGSDCVCSCVTHMGWPWGPHMCLPIQNPYTDQPCESYLGLMWAAYMGLIVFAHVWLIWVGHEVPICVYPFRTHIQINRVCPTLGSCGQPIWVWLCLLMCDSYGLAMRSPHVFTHSEPISDQPCESYLGLMCSLYGLIVFAHVRLIWVGHEAPHVFTHSPIYRSTMWVLPWLMWAAYMGLIVFAHVWLIWVGHEVHICVYPFRTHIQINHVSPTLGTCGQHIWVWLCLLMCDSYGLAMRSPYVFTHSEPIYRSTMCVLPWAHVGSLYGSDCVCSCVTHMGWPWGPHMCLPIQNPYKDQRCESYLGPICVAYMRLIVFAHVRTIWVVHEGPTCDTHLAPIHLFPINDPYGTYIGSPLLLAHVGPI